MGLLGDIIKDVTREAKYTLKNEIRNEVRQDTRDAVRGTINSAKQGIGQAVTGNSQQQPNVVAAAPVAAPAPAPAPAPVAQAPVTPVAPAPAAPVQAVPQAAPAAPAAPASSENLGDAMANLTEQAAPMMQMANQLMNNDSPLGKIVSSVATAGMTDEQKSEMKQGLEMASDPAKMAEMQQALRDNSDAIEASMREQGVNTENLKNTMDNSANMLSQNS